MSFLSLLESVFLISLIDCLSSDSLLSDESLDLWGLVESLAIFSSDFSSDDVLSDIILLSKSKCGSDGIGSLGSESSRSLSVRESFNLTLSLDEHLEGDDGKVGATDASSDGLSLPLSGSSGSVEGDSSSHEDSDSTVDQDSLLHGESLLVISSSDSESVSLELWSKNDTINIGAHSPVGEVSVDLVIIDIEDLLLSGLGVGDVILHLYKEILCVK